MDVDKELVAIVRKIKRDRALYNTFTSFLYHHKHCCEY